MAEETKAPESDRATIAKLDAMQVGLAVLQALLYVRRGESSEVDLLDHDVTIRILAQGYAQRVICVEV